MTTIYNQINFIEHILHDFRDTLIWKKKLWLLPINDSIFNHINIFGIFISTFRNIHINIFGIFIDSEAIEENAIPQFINKRHFILTRNRYDFKKSTNEDDHNSLLFTLLEFKYLNSCLKTINRKNNLKTYCQIECYINLANRTLTELKNIQRKNINLMMTDTDSFSYHIKNQDVYKIMENNKDKFDLGNYPEDHC